MRKKKLPAAIRGYELIKTDQLNLAVQHHCQATIQHGLTRITELITDADLDALEEIHLLNVVAHILGHIQGETHDLKSEMRGRVN